MPNFDVANLPSVDSEGGSRLLFRQHPASNHQARRKGKEPAGRRRYQNRTFGLSQIASLGKAAVC
jgi:hypothetical protein